MEFLLIIQLLCWPAAMVLFVMSTYRRNWDVDQTIKAAHSPFRPRQHFTDDTGYRYHMASLILFYVGGLATVVFSVIRVFG